MRQALGPAAFRASRNSLAPNLAAANPRDTAWQSFTHARTALERIA